MSVLVRDFLVGYGQVWRHCAGHAMLHIDDIGTIARSLLSKFILHCRRGYFRGSDDDAYRSPVDSTEAFSRIDRPAIIMAADEEPEMMAQALLFSFRAPWNLAISLRCRVRGCQEKLYPHYPAITVSPPAGDMVWRWAMPVSFCPLDILIRGYHNHARFPQIMRGFAPDIITISGPVRERGFVPPNICISETILFLLY